MAHKLLKRGDCLLVIIDAQERLMPVIAGQEELTANLVRLAKFARIAGIPAVVTEQEKLGPTLSPIAEALGDFSPISKISFDSFACRDFSQALGAHKKETLIITGVEAHICVFQTALNALSGHRVQVLADGVGSRNPLNRQVALDRLRGAGAVISSTEMFIYEILRQAGTDEFRATLPLVK